MSWIGFPYHIRNSILRRLRQKQSNKISHANEDRDEDELPKVWIRITYLGRRGECLINSCLNKLKRCLFKPVKFIIIHKTKKFPILLRAKILFGIFPARTLSTKLLALVATRIIWAKLLNFSIFLCLTHILGTKMLLFGVCFIQYGKYHSAVGIGSINILLIQNV